MQVFVPTSSQISHCLSFVPFFFQLLPCQYFFCSLSLCCVFLSFSISRLYILCVSVYNSDSLLPSLIQSPSLSAALFLPRSSSPSVTLIPFLIHWRFIGIQAGLFCQAITVQNSMKAQFWKCAFSLFPWLPPPLLPWQACSFLSFNSPLSLFFTQLFVCIYFIFNALILSFFLSICQHLTPPLSLPSFCSAQLHLPLVDPFLLSQFPL